MLICEDIMVSMYSYAFICTLKGLRSIIICVNEILRQKMECKIGERFCCPICILLLHTHTQIHTYAHPHTYTHTHTLSHTHTQAFNWPKAADYGGKISVLSCFFTGILSLFMGGVSTIQRKRRGKRKGEERRREGY